MIEDKFQRRSERTRGNFQSDMKMGTSISLIVLFFLSLFFVKSTHADEKVYSVKTKTNSLIYGEDTRQEARAHTNEVMRSIARRSVISMIPKIYIQLDEDKVSFETVTLVEDSFVCEDERFAYQPVLAECSGVLVDNDIVLTAGHCFIGDYNCNDLYFVLDYTIDEDENIQLLPEKIFECNKVVHSELSHFADQIKFDYAIVKLDRSVAGIGEPVAIRQERVFLGENLTLIGNSLGLPTKIDSDGIVVFEGSDENDYFSLQVDMFHRGSGSPLFDTEGKLVGIGVRGGVDFDSADECMKTRTVDSSTRYFEEAGYANEALIRSGFSHLVNIDGEKDSSVSVDHDNNCSAINVSSNRETVVKLVLLLLSNNI